MGGQGSGNFDHAGRPGLVGGSGSGGSTTASEQKQQRLTEKHTRDRQFKETLIKEADSIRDRDKEFMVVYDKNGKELQRWEGTTDEVGDPEWLADNSLDTIQLHNHPVSKPGDEDYEPDYPDHANKPPSLQDFSGLARDGTKALLVASKDYNFALTRTGPPFTKVQGEKMMDLMEQRLKTSEGFRYPTHADWQWITTQVKGFTYSRKEK